MPGNQSTTEAGTHEASSKDTGCKESTARDNEMNKSAEAIANLDQTRY